MCVFAHACLCLQTDDCEELCVYVCARESERESERERECVCVWERERVCAREKERVCVCACTFACVEIDDCEHLCM